MRERLKLEIRVTRKPLLRRPDVNQNKSEGFNEEKILTRGNINEETLNEEKSECSSGEKTTNRIIVVLPVPFSPSSTMISESENCPFSMVRWKSPSVFCI